MIFGGPEKSKFTNNSEEKINCVDNLHSKTLFSKIVDLFALNYDFLQQAVQTNSNPSKNHEIGIWNFFSHGYMFVKNLVFFMFRPI